MIKTPSLELFPEIKEIFIFKQNFIMFVSPFLRKWKGILLGSGSLVQEDSTCWSLSSLEVEVEELSMVFSEGVAISEANRGTFKTYF